MKYTLLTNIKSITKNLTLLMASLGFATLLTVPAFAQAPTPTTPATPTTPGGSSASGSADVSGSVCDGIEATGGKCTDNNGDSFKSIVTTVINVLSIGVGAISVIMIIVGGFRYVVSNGDSNGLQGAKNTILYAIVGLVIVLFAQIIVRFVYSSVEPAVNGTTGTSQTTP